MAIPDADTVDKRAVKIATTQVMARIRRFAEAAQDAGGRAGYRSSITGVSEYFE